MVAKKGSSEVEVLESAGMMRWLLTYADMITLLLIVFIILFAISTISPKKFQSFEKGIVPAFAPGSNPVFPGSVSLLKFPSVLEHIGSQSVSALTQAANNVLGTPLQAVTAATSSQLAQEIEQALERAGLAQYAIVETTPQGTVVEILATTTFASYSAQLTPLGQAIVDTVSGVIEKLPNDVLVAGYTDDNPVVCSGGGIACPYSNNYELSAARAASVGDRMAELDGISFSRLFGYFAGQNDPVAPNRDMAGNPIPANQALNRRVDIEILNANSVGQPQAPTGTGLASNVPTIATPFATPASIPAGGGNPSTMPTGG